MLGQIVGEGQSCYKVHHFLCSYDRERKYELCLHLCYATKCNTVLIGSVSTIVRISESSLPIGGVRTNTDYCANNVKDWRGSDADVYLTQQTLFCYFSHQHHATEPALSHTTSISTQHPLPTNRPSSSTDGGLQNLSIWQTPDRTARNTLEDYHENSET